MDDVDPVFDSSRPLPDKLAKYLEIPDPETVKIEVLDLILSISREDKLPEEVIVLFERAFAVAGENIGPVELTLDSGDARELFAGLVLSANQFSEDSGGFRANAGVLLDIYKMQGVLGWDTVISCLDPDYDLEA